MAALGIEFDPSAVARLTCVDELRTYDQWVAWKKEPDPPRSKPKKVPINPRSQFEKWASSTDPKTWGTYDGAVACVARLRLAGVGFVLTDEDDFIGIDIDACRDAETGEISPWAQTILAFGETYAEVSPSGTGIRMIARGDPMPAAKSNAAGVEVYFDKRYLTITQAHIEGSPLYINPAPRTLAALLARVEEFRKPQDALAERQPIAERAASKSAPAGSADDFFTTVKRLALQNLAAWVPAIFPRARPQSGTGAYRISSKSLGRNLEEDLSIAPNGIVDFGVHDMGDPREGKRTAIDIVMEYGGAPDALAAAKWLCERMGVDPESLGALPERAEWDGEFRNPQPRATIVEGGVEGDLAAKGAPAPSQDPLAGVVFDGDDAAIEPPRMLLKRLAPAEGICFIGGQSGAGKTFVAVDLAVSLASGEPFLGHKVAERVGVVILAAEGSGTIGMRVHVARNEKAFGEILPIAWLGSAPDLSNPKELPPLVTRLQAIGARFCASHGVRLGAVIIDTVAAAANLKDENDNAEAARAIRQMNELSRALGIVVMPVHHYGKGQETGLRGASAWRAGADTVISVLAERNEITGHVAGRKIALAKSRYGEEGPIAAFELRFVKTGEDEDGEDVGACVVEPSAADPGAAETGKASRPSRAMRAYLEALQIALLGDRKEKIRPFEAEGPEVTAVDREAVRGEFYCAWPADGDTEAKRAASKRKTFNRAEGELIERKLICAREIDLRTFVWAVTRQANAEP